MKNEFNRGVMISRLMILLLLLVSFSTTSAQAADVFMCKDAMGRTAFQDHPCHSAEAEKKIKVFVAPKPPPVESEVESPDVAATADAETKNPEKKIAASKNFAWKITKGKKQGYLMGSIHFGKASMYPLPVTLLNAFKGTDALVVEANVVDADQNMLAQTMMSAGVYTDGQTLKTVLSKSSWNDLNVTASELGIPVAMVEGMKPWFASMTLTALALKKIGLDESLGIDRHFLDLAKKEHKPIRELESVEQQLALLSGLPKKVQLAMLEQTINDIGNAKEYFDTMLKAWQAGDVSAIDKQFVDDMKKSAENRKLNKVMITDRNAAMAKGVDAMVRGGCNCFVVVGAGHLGGEKGIIKLLQGKGYEVEQM